MRLPWQRTPGAAKDRFSAWYHARIRPLEFRQLQGPDGEHGRPVSIDRLLVHLDQAGWRAHRLAFRFGHLKKAAAAGPGKEFL